MGSWLPLLVDEGAGAGAHLRRPYQSLCDRRGVRSRCACAVVAWRPSSLCRTRLLRVSQVSEDPVSGGSEGLECVLCQCGMLSADMPYEPWKRMWGREVGHGANAQRPCVASSVGQTGAPTDPWGRRQEGEQLRAGEGAGRMPRLGAPHAGCWADWRLWCRGPEPCSPVHPGSSLSIELPFRLLSPPLPPMSTARRVGTGVHGPGPTGRVPVCGASSASCALRPRPGRGSPVLHLPETLPA